ncbi:hypothetical protein ACHAXH_010015 [Discostella pseudostelligera]
MQLQSDPSGSRLETTTVTKSPSFEENLLAEKKNSADDHDLPPSKVAVVVNGSGTTTSSTSSIKNFDSKSNDVNEIIKDDKNSSAENDAGLGDVATLTNDDDTLNNTNANTNNDEANGGHCPHNNNSTTIDANISTNDKANAKEIAIDTPTRRNSRQIKKRREDGFFYAQDDKKEGTTTVVEKKLKTLTSNEIDQQQQHDNLQTQSAAISSCSIGTDKSKQQSHVRQQQVSDEGPYQPTKKQRTSQKCPINDTILIQIPLSVTADLGVAMKRTRKKRTKRIKRWLRMHEKDDGGPRGKSATSLSCNNEMDTTTGDITTKKGKTEQGSEKERCAKDDDDLGGVGDEGDEEDDEDDDNTGPMDKKQYGSIVDYLEAKYVRGVMIDDYDEKEARKKKKRKVKAAASENDGEDNNDEEEDSEKEGSIYSSDDGFIDDSLLNEEVVDQLIASRSYGMTQIEEEARRRAKQREKKGGQEAQGDKKDDELLNGEDASDDNDDEGSAAISAAELDFDDGFFVNLGDLEMAEGWSGDHDVIMSPMKNINRKRAYNKKSATTSSNANKLDTKIAKKKNVKAKAAPPGGVKKKLVKDTTKKLMKDEKSDSDKAKIKKTKKSENGSVVKKKKKADKEGGKVGNDKSPLSKKKPESSSSPKNNATSMADTSSNAKSPKASGVTTNKPSKSKSLSPPKEKVKKPMSKEKEKATQLRMIYKRRYNSCLKLIEKMTSEDLPRKPKTKNTMKVSVNIPVDKEIGDDLTFGNPNVPGQKLKVQIPKNADMEKRRFVVSIPAPKVTEPVVVRENNFTQAFREALSNYSDAFDEWCNAEGEHNDSLPADKRKQFKPGVEKLKKFDDMANEFPKNLATPVDASCLRKIAKKERNNKSRRERRKSGGSTTAAGGAKVKIEQKQNELEVHIPHKGRDFPTISFDMRDFS